MKTPTLPLTAVPLAIFALLAACSSEPENYSAPDNDPDAATIAAAPPVELPPMLTGSRTYRCKDNSLIYIDFFSNNTALYKTEKDATTGTTLTSEGEGQPYVAEGYSVSGNSDNIELTAPGKGSTTCKA
ncbi:MAG: hypothetical protein AB7G25_13515 [Sphingomonadaceae bacterium]